MKKNLFKAFTLAEIMIVLTIIGILTAILLPIAFHSAPDENVLKFKKGNNTLGTVIRELVNSDEYYADGDLGKKANGDYVLEKDYFLKTLGDVMNVKDAVYPNNEEGEYKASCIVTDADNLKETLDTRCKTAQSNLKNYIETIDDIYYYLIDYDCVFGAEYIWIDPKYRNPFYVKWDNKVSYTYCESLSTADEKNQCVIEHAKSGFYFVKMVFCMDVDGINKGEDPFGYAIRVDGKITLGERAEEWLKKSIQKGE